MRFIIERDLGPDVSKWCVCLSNNHEFAVVCSNDFGYLVLHSLSVSLFLSILGGRGWRRRERRGRGGCRNYHDHGRRYWQDIIIRAGILLLFSQSSSRNGIDIPIYGVFYYVFRNSHFLRNCSPAVSSYQLCRSCEWSHYLIIILLLWTNLCCGPCRAPRRSNHG